MMYKHSWGNYSIGSLPNKFMHKNLLSFYSYFGVPFYNEDTPSFKYSSFPFRMIFFGFTHLSFPVP